MAKPWTFKRYWKTSKNFKMVTCTSLIIAIIIGGVYLIPGMISSNNTHNKLDQILENQGDSFGDSFSENYGFSLEVFEYDLESGNYVPSSNNINLTENQIEQINEILKEAWKYHLLGDFEKEIDYYNEALKINPEIFEALSNKGAILVRLGRYEEARIFNERALKLNTISSEAWNNQGSILSYLVRYEEAIEAYNNAIKINPKNYGAFFNKGKLLHGLGKYKEAIKEYNNAIKINPEYTEAYTNKGSALYFLGRYEEAIEVEKIAVSINPEEIYAWYNLGQAYSALGRYKEAIEAYSRDLEISPNNTKTLNNRGVLFADINESFKAIADFEASIAINSTSLAWANLGSVLANTGRFNEALEAFDKDLENYPEHYDTMYYKGYILAHLGRHEEATAVLTNSFRLNSSFDPENLYQPID